MVLKHLHKPYRLRLFAALINEPNRVMQIKAFFAGVYDALLKNTGRRHDYWKL